MVACDFANIERGINVADGEQSPDRPEFLQNCRMKQDGLAKVFVFQKGDLREFFNNDLWPTNGDYQTEKYVIAVQHGESKERMRPKTPINLGDGKQNALVPVIQDILLLDTFGDPGNL